MFYHTFSYVVTSEAKKLQDAANGMQAVLSGDLYIKIAYEVSSHDLKRRMVLRKSDK